MWAEVAPAATQLWTSSGRRPAGLRHGRHRRRRATVPLRPVRRAGGRGAALGRDRRRLLPRPPVPGRPGRRRRCSCGRSTSPAPPRRVLELELPGVAAESEGLDVLDARGGLLHWLLSPFAPGGKAPTYGTGHSELLTFVAAADARLRVRVAPAHVVAGRATRVTVTVTHRYSGRVHRVCGCPRGRRRRARAHGSRRDGPGDRGPVAAGSRPGHGDEGAPARGRRSCRPRPLSAFARNSVIEGGVSGRRRLWSSSRELRGITSGFR